MVGRRHERLGLRYSKVFAWLAGLASVAFLLVLLVWQIFPASAFRTTVLLLGDSMLVASWDGEKKHVTIIELPATLTITGLLGVGEYSLESLGKLGEFDIKDRTLLASSLSETLAVPIPWYIGPVDDRTSGELSSETSVRAIFSLGNLWKMVTGQYHTNLPMRTFLSLLFATNSLRTDAFSTLRIADTTAIVPKDLVDGTRVDFLDIDRLDVLLGTRFEEEKIRAESLRVTIYNTTATPTLGRRMERRISRAGALVVGVGNERPAVDRCLVTGFKEKLTSNTVGFLQHFFHCEIREGESGRSDIDVRVGTAFEKLFLPRTN